MTFTASGARSTNVQCTAPRDSSSMPIAPLPAYRSAIRAPEIASRLTSELAMDPRTMSVVGRVPMDGTAIGRPRNCPAMTRIGPD